MAEEIVFNTRVDTGNTVGDVEKVEQSIEKLDNSIKDVGTTSAKTAKDVVKSTKDMKAGMNDVLTSSDSFEDKLKKLNKIVKETPLNVRDMNKQIQAYQSIALTAGRETPIGKQALAQAAQLRDRYIDIQNETKRLADDQKNLKGVIDIGSTAVAGYGALNSAMAITGNNSEDLRKTMIKLQAAQTLLTSLDQIRTSLQKESNAMLLINNIRTKVATAVQLAYTKVVGKSTGAMKGLRTAMLGIPLLALIAAITTIVALWDEIVGVVSDASIAQAAYNDTIEDYGKGAQEAIKTTNEVENAFKLAREGVISKEEALKTYNDQLGETFGTAKDLEEAERIYVDKTDAYVQASALRAQANALIEKSAEKQVEGLTAALEDQTSFMDKVGAGFSNLFGSQEDLVESLTEKQRQRTKELQTNAGRESEVLQNLAQDILKQAETIENANGIASDSEKALQKERDERAKKWQKEQEEAVRLQQERQKLLVDFMVASIEDESLRSLEALRVKHEREQAQLVEKFGEDTELMKELTLKQEAELNKLKEDIRKKEEAAQEKLDADQQKEEEERAKREAEDRKAQLEGELIQARNDAMLQIELQKELAQLQRDQALLDEDLTEGEKFKIREQYKQRIEELEERSAKRSNQIEKDSLAARQKITEGALGSIQALSDIVFSVKMSRLKEGSKAEEEAAKKQFRINKTLQLVGAITDGYKAITASLSQSPISIGPVPNPAGIASLAFAITTSAANVAKIAATRFQPTGGGGGGAGGGGGTVGAPSIPSTIPEGESTLTAPLLPGAQGQGTEQLGPGQGSAASRVVLVDSDVKASLDEGEKVEMISTIG